MHYLIDGYNLLHAMGALTGRVGPNGLASGPTSSSPTWSAWRR